MSLPEVTVMCSATLDGRLAPAAGTSSRPFVEVVPEEFGDELDRLREAVDAVVVGSRTIHHDDSRLLPPSGGGVVRGTMDPDGILGMDRTVLADDHRTVVGVTERTDDEYVAAVDGRENKRAVVVGETDPDLREYLAELADGEGVDRLLLEGGGRSIYHALRREFVDHLRVLYLPYVVGDEDAVTLADGPASLFPDVRLSVTRRESVRDFTLIAGDLEYGD